MYPYVVCFLTPFTNKITFACDCKITLVIVFYYLNYIILLQKHCLAWVVKANTLDRPTITITTAHIHNVFIVYHKNII